MLAGRIRMTFIVPHKLKCPQRRQRGHDLLATTAIAAQGICWITAGWPTLSRFLRRVGKLGEGRILQFFLVNTLKGAPSLALLGRGFSCTGSLGANPIRSRRRAVHSDSISWDEESRSFMTCSTCVRFLPLLFPCSLKPAERLFRECLAAAWATDFHLGTSPWDWELSLRGWPWGWELFCTGEGVQLTSPPGWQKPRRPASKLEKIVGGAGTSRTADQVCSSCFVG